MDPTRKFARLEFNGVAARPLGTPGGAADPFARTMVEAVVCLANEMVGGADRLREDALAYAMMRMQFGKPIAWFQSMKHKHADMLLEVELAKSAANLIFSKSGRRKLHRARPLGFTIQEPGPP